MTGAYPLSAPGPVPTIDAVIPARNEEATVGSVVEACRASRWVREVLVVDDGSDDATVDQALAAGAKVVSRQTASGSKAHAMAAGVAASDAEAVLFVDADLLGLTAGHLDDICLPYVQGRAGMSIGWFDYGRLNNVVLRLPPTTGERVVPRWVFEAVPPWQRDGYTIEMVMNSVVTTARLPTTARTMRGVTHRTKRDKFGFLEGYRRTWKMFAEIVGLPLRGVVRWRSYWVYLSSLTVEAPSPGRRQGAARRRRVRRLALRRMTLGPQPAARSARRREMTRRARVSSAPSKIDRTRASTK